MGQSYISYSSKSPAAAQMVGLALLKVKVSLYCARTSPRRIVSERISNEMLYVANEWHVFEMSGGVNVGFISCSVSRQGQQASCSIQG